MKPKICFGLNSTWNLVNFRAGLIRAFLDAGYEVIALAPKDQYAPQLSELGCRLVHIPMKGNGTHPGRDLLLLCRFWWLLKHERPSIYLGYTVKPNVYGSLAAHCLQIPVINNVAGLGSVFLYDGWLTFVVKFLYRLAFFRSRKVFFQNEEDRLMFVSKKIVRTEIADRLPGSGINLHKFSVCPLPTNERIRFLLIARMLWDKGVGEFVQAARLLKKRGVNAEFFLLGFLDVENPSAIKRTQIEQWVAEEVVGYLGVSDNVKEQIMEADCVVLPSYREGVPRALLEAAAMGRPIVTTNAVGCRDAVENGITGYLCAPRDANDLAEKLECVVLLTTQERTKMGLAGRKKMESEFDEKLIIQRYLEAVHTFSK